MYPLDTQPVVYHIINRTISSPVLDEVVLATSTASHDQVLASQGKSAGAIPFRGSESDVLKRMYDAAEQVDADIVVRVCADNPLISPDYISVAARSVLDRDIDYAGYPIGGRILPLGVGAEAFTMTSFRDLERRMEEQHEREHVTVGYKENQSTYSVVGLTCEDVFDEPEAFNRPKLRLTLDTPPDYRLFQEVYDNVAPGERGIIELSDAIEYIDAHGLNELNREITQKDPRNNE